MREQVSMAYPISKHQNSDPNPQKAKQVLSKALLRVVEKMEITRRELSAIQGISEASISRLYDGSRLISPASKEGELATLLLRIYRSLDSVFGGNEIQCRFWFRSYNHHLKAIPAEQVKNIQGMIAVASYLDAMRGKL